MKRRLVKFISIILASAVAAGALFFCGFSFKLPAGVYINGVQAGGLTRAGAADAVRRDIVRGLKNKSLTVHAGGCDYVFKYPEINFSDNALSVIKSISGAGSYSVDVKYYLNGFDEVVSGICAAQSQKMAEPCYVFNPYEGEPFEYENGKNGVYCDKARLAADISHSLCCGFCDVYLHTKEFTPFKTMDEVKRSTALLSSFVTYFDGANQSRSQNIALAAKRISGFAIKPEGVFSFNQSVGPRTKERGFKTAKVIAGGKYIYGVGGGVCQVSTTLYNAALLAGLKVTEYHPHSLPVSYISPSRDAMVSGSYCDLKLKNLSDCPVYIRVLTGKNYVRCELYGKSDGFVYSLNSEMLENADDGGIRSRCVLTKERDGVKISELIRSDRYLRSPSDEQDAMRG
ncbi:MAG: VanW family protein [Clostridia bacterium]|nr:VanW family protein [Clostridia bacterium]